MNLGSLRSSGRPAGRDTIRHEQERGGRPLTARRLLLRVLPPVLVVAVVVAVGLPTIIYPFGSDQAIFAMIGKTIGEGGFPYVDAWDQKPPAIYLIYTVAIRGPLGVMRNVRVFDLAWMAVTVVAIIELGRRWWNPRAGVIAGLLYGLVYVTTTGYWYLAQPDGFIALPLVLALLLYEIARGRWSLLIAVGVLLGFAFQLRFIMALLIPFIPLVEIAALPGWRPRLRLWFRRMVWLGAGFVAFQAALALYLVAGGALGEYIEATRFASGYTRLGGPYSPEGLTLSNYWETFRYSPLWWALSRLALTAPAIVGGFLGVFVLRERRVQQVTLFCVLAYAGIAAQAKFFPYHWLYLTPFVALLAGWGWDRAFALLFQHRSRPMALTAGALLVAGLALSTPDVLDAGWKQWQGHLRYYREPENREFFYDYFGPWNGGTFSYRASRDTAYYLQRRTQPGESLYIWGYDPLIYLLADRPSASRFVYSFPLMSNWAPPSWQPEFLEELRTNQPVYFVIQRYEGARWITGHKLDSGDFIAWFPDLQQWLQDGYELEAEIEDYLIFRRKT